MAEPKEKAIQEKKAVLPENQISANGIMNFS